MKNEMTQTCYRTLAIILRERSDYDWSDAQLGVLLSSLRHDVEEMDHQNATFALFKAVLARRLVLPEVYDIMLRMGELMVQSAVATVRTHCASIYLTFLLDYPLETKRLNYHIRFLVNNLTFVYETGRLAALACLHALVRPVCVLTDSTDVIFQSYRNDSRTILVCISIYLYIYIYIYINR
jgi:U3 small nucleolar RNA-associated protein 20